MLLNPLLLLLALTVQAPPSTGQSTVSPEVTLVAQREADVHNYLVMRLRLLKRGAAVEEMKSEIVNGIDFGTLSPRSVELLRRMMGLCDKAIAGQAKLGKELAAVDQEMKKEDTHAVGTIATALLTGGTSLGLSSLLAGLQNLEVGGASAAHRADLLAQSAVELGAELSTLEFDLAVFRSQVQADGKLDPREFITPSDYDTFLSAATGTSENEKVTAIVKALEGSPRLEPAALNLATHFYRTGEKANCVHYADLVIATAPRILRRDPLRAHAYALKAHLALANKDYGGAVAAADLGISDEPSSAALLSAKATGLVLGGDYAGGLPLLEKLTLLVPDDPTVHYNLACCQSVAAKDVDASMKSLQAAFACGFADVAHAKSDPDLGLLREKVSDVFQALTSMKLGLRLQPAHELFATSDFLRITNESAFVLEHVELSLTFSGHPTSVRTPTPTSFVLSVKIDRLEPGKLLTSRDVGERLRTGFTTLQVVASGAQGRFEKTYSRKELE